MTLVLCSLPAQVLSSRMRLNSSICLPPLCRGLAKAQRWLPLPSLPRLFNDQSKIHANINITAARSSHCGTHHAHSRLAGRWQCQPSYRLQVALSITSTCLSPPHSLSQSTGGQPGYTPAQQPCGAGCVANNSVTPEQIQLHTADAARISAVQLVYAFKQADVGMCACCTIHIAMAPTGLSACCSS
jgi:hypothetical protein